MITNLRNARDAVMSYMRFMRTGFDQVLSVIGTNLGLANHYQSLPEDRRIVLRYKDMIGSPAAVVAGIAERIGLDVGGDVVADVAARFRKDRSKRRSKGGIDAIRKPETAISPSSARCCSAETKVTSPPSTRMPDFKPIMCPTIGTAPGVSCCPPNRPSA